MKRWYIPSLIKPVSSVIPEPSHVCNPNLCNEFSNWWKEARLWGGWSRHSQRFNINSGAGGPEKCCGMIISKAPVCQQLWEGARLENMVGIGITKDVTSLPRWWLIQRGQIIEYLYREGNAYAILVILLTLIWRRRLPYRQYMTWKDCAVVAYMPVFARMHMTRAVCWCGWRRSPPYFCLNDMMAIASNEIQVLHGSIRYAEDMNNGFDDNPVWQFVLPSLSTK